MKVTIHDLSHCFYHRNKEPLWVFKNFSLKVDSGEFVVLLGPSGCGKSTLLQLLAGLISPCQGEILLDNEPPLVSQTRKQVAWMAQKPALLPWKTVFQNVALAQKVNPQNGRTLLPVTELISLVGLQDFADAFPFTLSGGMQQRAALARTLSLNALLWLMDEPFAALDEITREELQEQTLALIHRFRPTVIWVTHNIAEAIKLAQRVIVLSQRPAAIQAEFTLPDEPRDEMFYAKIAPTIRKALQLKG